MSFENKGSMPTTVTVSLEPDRSGNFPCSGVADDVDINAAITHVGLMGGGIVHIKAPPIGTTNYDITATITDQGYNNIILEGEGWNTLLRMTVDNTPLLYLTSCNRWVVRDLAFDGNRDNVDEHLVVVTAGVDYSRFSNLEVMNGGDSGFHVQESNDNIIENCYIHNISEAPNGCGIRISGADDGSWRNLLLGNTVEDTYEHGIKVYDPTNYSGYRTLNKIIGNTIRGPGPTPANAIDIEAWGTTVAENTIYLDADSDQGIRVDGSFNTIGGNVIENSLAANACVEVSGDKNTFSRNVLNILNQTGGIGFEVNEGDYNKFGLNVVNGGLYGIYVDGDYNDFHLNTFDSDRCVLNTGTGNSYGALQSWALSSHVDTATASIFPTIWVPIFDDTHAQVSLGNIGDHFGPVMANNQDSTFRFSFTVPSDYKGPKRFILELITVAANPTIRWSLATDFGQCAEAYNANSRSKAVGDTDLVQNDISCMEIGLLTGYPFNGMTMNDRVGTLFTRNGAHANDDAGDVLVHGFRLAYY